MALTRIAAFEQVSAEFAKNLSQLMLQNSPASLTPGNEACIRHFDFRTGRAETICLTPHGRPEHFLRPTQDAQFMGTGVFSVARQVCVWSPLSQFRAQAKRLTNTRTQLKHSRFLPEDMLHASALLEPMRFARCDWSEVPASAVGGEFELLPDRHYSVWRPPDLASPHPRAEHGSIVVRTDGEPVVELSTHHDHTHLPGTAVSDDMEESVQLQVLPFDSWHVQLRALGFVVTPMVFRRGACIRCKWEGDAVGCIVPTTDDGLNFSPGDCTYDVVLSDDACVKVFFKEALDNLIPCGEELYLQGSAIQGLDPAVLLAVRLNVPPVASPPRSASVYVTYMCKSVFANRALDSVTYRTVPVPPASLLVRENLRGRAFLQHVCVRGARS